MGLKNCWHCWRFELKALDLKSQSVAIDHSATVLDFINYCDGSGSKIFDPGQVGSGQGQPSMVWVWKISPKNVK